MKNKFQLLAALVLLVIATVGCGLISRASETAPEQGKGNSNKTVTDRAVDKAVGESNIGVPECDEVMNMITEELNNSDDDFVTKAIKATVLNRIKDSIKESIEKDNSDTVELAKTCKEFRTQFDKYKEEEKNKQHQ